ncbi:MAG: DNA polymerase III subunit delta [Planctomycetota bacterium]
MWESAMAARKTSDPSFQDLAKHLRTDEPLPAYAIVGTEPFTRGQAVRGLRKAVLGDAPPDLALSQYTSADLTDAAPLLDELRTAPFLASRRLVVVEDAAAFVKANKSALVRYLETPARTGVLVLVLDKLSRSDKLGKAVRKVGMVVHCSSPRERELPGWIDARVRAYRKRIDPAAARRLADCVGVNLPVLDQSINKLSLYVGDRDTIAEADVDALVEDLPVTTIFRLTDAVGTQDPAKALRVLDTLLEQNNEPAYIISMIRWALERLIQTRTLLDEGQGKESIAKTLRMRSSYFLDKTIEMARRRSAAELHRGFRLLLDTDLATKTSTMDARDALEHLLLKLCA